METPNPIHQVVDVICSKDFKFTHIDAGIGDNMLPRHVTLTQPDGVADCLLYPVVDKMVREEFPELRELALTIRIKWV